MEPAWSSWSVGADDEGLLALVELAGAGVDDYLEGSLPALIYPGGQGYMKSPSRVQLESYYNTIG